MNHKITVPLSVDGINKLLKKIDEYERWLKKKANQLSEELARLGVQNATVGFSEALYDGINDATVTVQQNGPYAYKVLANGNAVLFIEFGTGVYYSDPEHPEAAINGFLRGTYGKGLGKNMYWFYTGQPGTAGGVLATDPKTGKVHPNTTITHGNPANMTMWATVKNLEYEFSRIVQEVFND